MTGPTGGPQVEASPGQGVLTVIGCTPPASAITVKLLEVGAGSQSPFALPAVQSPNPSAFLFSLPPGAKPGGLYKVDVGITDPACPTATSGGTGYLIAAGTPKVLWPLGKTTLEASSLASLAPQGGFGQWVTQREQGGILQDWTQLFKWSPEGFSAAGAIWQASFQPFATGGDPTAIPPGLIGAGGIDCAGCTFQVDLGDLIPAPAAQKQPSSASGAGGKAAQPWQTNVVDAMFSPGKMLHSGLIKSSGVTKSSPSTLVGKKGPALLPAPLTIYFRVIPVSKSGAPTGPPSNNVLLTWTGKGGSFDLKIVDCKTNPTHPSCPPPPPPPEYELEILSYADIVNPDSSHANCFISTEAATVLYGPLGPMLTYPKGSHFCPPEPKEPGWLESLVDWAIGALDWVSDAYDKLKSEVVSALAQVVPGSLCPPPCLDFALNAALAAAGMPPSIPNFDELTDKGLDYLAEQAVAQANIPPELQSVAKDQFKKGIKAGIEAASKQYSYSVSYVPDGVAVKPDPLAELQPATLSFKLTRKLNSPGNCVPGQISITSYLTKVVPEPTGEAAKFDSGQLFQSKTIAPASLAPGESFNWDVQLRPNWVLQWGKWGPSPKDWEVLYLGGTVHFDVSGSCGASDGLTVVAHAG